MWLPDRQTDGQTNGQIDTEQKWSLCALILRRQHKNGFQESRVPPAQFWLWRYLLIQSWRRSWGLNCWWLCSPLVCLLLSERGPPWRRLTAYGRDLGILLGRGPVLEPEIKSGSLINLLKCYSKDEIFVMAYMSKYPDFGGSLRILNPVSPLVPSSPRGRH